MLIGDFGSYRKDRSSTLLGVGGGMGDWDTYHKAERNMKEQGN